MLDRSPCEHRRGFPFSSLRAPSVTCDDDSQCLGGTCELYSVCSPNGRGGACDADALCDTSHCSNGMCSCLPAGALALEEVECCSLALAGGACICGRGMSACLEDSDCCTG